MKKYEEKHYQYETIKGSIYPWVKDEIRDAQALNGKYIKEDEVPAVSFAGDLKVIFVIHRGENRFEILTDHMLAPGSDIEQIYHMACENLVRDVEFVIANTWYGAFAIIADGYHEASALCFRHIWQVCVDKLKDDLVIMVPSRDTVLFAPAGQTEAVNRMMEHAGQAYESSRDKISEAPLLFTKDRRELTAYVNES